MQTIRDFPDAQEEEYIYMEQETMADTSLVHAFAYAKETDDGMPYVAVYVWDPMLTPVYCRMFVICDGCSFTKEEEAEFLRYAHCSDLHMDDNHLYSFNEKVKKWFPQWHYKHYDAESAGIAVEHMYFASHRSGAKEILYKAGFDNVAFLLDQLPDIDPSGTTPSAILGHDIPIRLLRILNQKDLNKRLFCEAGIEESKKVYKTFAGYMRMLPNVYQWHYLEMVLHKKGTLGRLGFNRTLYDRLTMAKHDSFLEAYDQFMMYKEKYAGFQKLKIPKAYEIINTVRMIEECEEDYLKRDPRIRERKVNDGFEYSGKDFSVVMPASSMDFCIEAIYQGNCVMEYAGEHADREVTVLFIRKKNAPDIPYVTMEVSGGEIRQVCARFNAMPPKEVYMFLFEYAKFAGFGYDAFYLINDKLCEDDTDEYEEYSDLLEYALEYKYKSEIGVVFEGLGLENYEDLISIPPFSEQEKKALR